MALSRIRSLDSCRVVSFTPSVIKAHPTVITFYDNFRSQAPVILKLLEEDTAAAATAAATAATAATSASPNTDSTAKSVALSSFPKRSPSLTTSPAVSAPQLKPPTASAGQRVLPSFITNAAVARSGNGGGGGGGGGGLRTGSDSARAELSRKRERAIASNPFIRKKPKVLTAQDERITAMTIAASDPTIAALSSTDALNRIARFAFNAESVGWKKDPPPKFIITPPPPASPASPQLPPAPVPNQPIVNNAGGSGGGGAGGGGGGGGGGGAAIEVPRPIPARVPIPSTSLSQPPSQMAIRPPPPTSNAAFTIKPLPFSRAGATPPMQHATINSLKPAGLGSSLGQGLGVVNKFSSAVPVNQSVADRKSPLKSPLPLSPAPTLAPSLPAAASVSPRQPLTDITPPPPTAPAVNSELQARIAENRRQALLRLQQRKGGTATQ